MDCLYVDLDATLLGPGGSLFLDADKSFTLLGARVLEACARAGCEVVLMTGRREDTVKENARLFGQTAYIFEAGSCVVLDGEEHWLTGPLFPGKETIHDQITAAGAPALLLDTYAGRLEYHDPWHTHREVSHLFRGLVDTAEVDALLEANGHGDLRLLDNGAAHRRSAALAALPDLRVYHLLPRGASKAAGVAFHRQARGYARSATIAVGDSREDLGAATEVGTMWLVANALERDPGIRAAATAHLNVRIAEESYGAGVYEAVVTTLAEG